MSEHVCVRSSGVAVYRGDGTFPHLGPGLEDELCAHRQLLAYDFPVPRLLEVGVHEGSTYVVEESLGQERSGIGSSRSWTLVASSAMPFLSLPGRGVSLRARRPLWSRHLRRPFPATSSGLSVSPRRRHSYPSSASTAVGGAPERQWFSHTQISD